MNERIHLSMPAAAHSAAEARRALDSLEDEVDPALLEDLRLMVTELVTNSVRHADTDGPADVGLSVSVAPDRVRVEVRDRGRGFDRDGARRRAPDGRDGEPELRAGGWGLYLVDRLASRWGVGREGGTRVWFELDCVDRRVGAGAA
jgi:anti-sigma regulatory factor (Ser/Thr protein kinase)